MVFVESQANDLSKAKVSNFYATLLSLWLPALALTAYLSQTTPLMIPGSDVWLHLIRIEHDLDSTWHTIWHVIKNLFGINDLLYLANLIHRTQSLISFALVFVSAKLILTVVFYKSSTSQVIINTGSWLAVIFWTVMHGFFAGPIFASWFIVFANNYQIAYPTYFFGVATLIYALHLYSLYKFNLKTVVLLAITATCIVFTGVIHASELPYFILAGLFLILAFFKIRLLPAYIGITAIFAAIIYLSFDSLPGIKTPTLFKVLSQESNNGTISTITSTGAETLSSDYGYNTFNYYFVFAFLSTALVTLLLQFKNNNSTDKRILVFILLSSTPSLLYLTNFGAGLLGMITYPTLAYRFTWSSFLFLGPAILTIYLYNHLKKIKWIAFALPLIALISIPLLSLKFERQQISYHYVRSLHKTLDPSNTRSGFSPHQKEWFEDAYSKIIQANFKKPICVDIYTAQYLYFNKNYKNVILPSRRYRGTGIQVDKELYDQCKYPINGGTVFKDLGITRGPWDYRGW